MPDEWEPTPQMVELAKRAATREPLILNGISAALKAARPLIMTQGRAEADAALVEQLRQAQETINQLHTQVEQHLQSIDTLKKRMAVLRDAVGWAADTAATLAKDLRDALEGNPT